MTDNGALAWSYDPGARVGMFNALPGTVTDSGCPHCRGKGLIGFLNEGEYFTVRECQCMGRYRQIDRMERSGLGRVVQEKTFENFLAEEPWQKTLKQGAMDYARGASGWLLICGQSGSGKTHLCTAVCNSRMQAGQQVCYMSWRDEAAAIKADLDGREARLDRFRKAELLYIDDLFKAGRGPDGTYAVTAADVGIAFDLLNYRYIHDLPTVISTERTPRELEKTDSAVGGRILEMAGRHIYEIAPDRRKNRRLRPAAS